MLVDIPHRNWGWRQDLRKRGVGPVRAIPHPPLAQTPEYSRRSARCLKGLRLHFPAEAVQEVSAESGPSLSSHHALRLLITSALS